MKQFLATPGRGCLYHCRLFLDGIVGLYSGLPYQQFDSGINYQTTYAQIDGR